MLRINLLPPYIYEGAKRRNVTILWVVLLLIVIGGFVFAKLQLGRELDAIKLETANNTQAANDADQAAADAKRINDESAAIRGKADFVKGAREYNLGTYPPLLTNVARYTMRRVLYDSASPSGQQVVLAAYAPSLADVGHYMIAMERNPKITQVNVAMNSIPGFPSSGQGQSATQATGERPGPGGHNFVATLMLTAPIPGGPSYPAGSGAAASTGGGGGGPMGMTGPPMGMSGGPMGMTGPPMGMSGGPPPGLAGGAPMAAPMAGTGGPAAPGVRSGAQ